MFKEKFTPGMRVPMPIGTLDPPPPESTQYYSQSGTSACASNIGKQLSL